MITIYTDGSSKGNPGPGGYGAIIINDGKSEILNSKSEIKEIGGREEKTTNNRMEMMAAIEALKSLEACPNNEIGRVEVYSDSEYLIKGITIWIKNWQNNKWKTKNKKEVLNKDLWEKLLELTKNKKIEWKKVLGHSGHKENERCDEIAQSFADGKNVKLYNGLKSGYKPVSS